MVAVVGRPALAVSAGGRDKRRLRGLPATVAAEAAAAGGRVEVVGSIGDDDAGDTVAVLLGRAGVGHAALLRDPAGRTPMGDAGDGPAPRLDARDVELGLRYIVDASVIVLAEALPVDVQRVILDAASYQGAAIVALVEPGGALELELAQVSTVLEAPPGDVPPFSAMVGHYAARLDAGSTEEEAFREAVRDSGWEAGGG